MNFASMTDQAVAVEFGRRIEQLRLERNLTQQAVADEVGMSRVSYGRLEAGEAKWVNVIAVLRVLGQLSVLEQALPDGVFSPMEQLKLKGKRRQRASGSRRSRHNGGAVTSDGSASSADLDW